MVILRESNKYGGSFAAEALVSVLDLPPEQRINGIIHSVQRVHQALSRAGLAGDAADMVDGISDDRRRG